MGITSEAGATYQGTLALQALSGTTSARLTLYTMGSTTYASFDTELRVAGELLVAGGIAVGMTSASVEDGVIYFNEISATPANPSASSDVKMYVKSDKLVLAYLDGAQIRYKYLDLTGAGVTWVHSTTAP